VWDAERLKAGGRSGSEANGERDSGWPVAKEELSAPDKDEDREEKEEESEANATGERGAITTVAALDMNESWCSGRAGDRGDSTGDGGNGDEEDDDEDDEEEPNS